MQGGKHSFQAVICLHIFVSQAMGASELAENLPGKAHREDPACSNCSEADWRKTSLKSLRPEGQAQMRRLDVPCCLLGDREDVSPAGLAFLLRHSYLLDW